MKRRALWIVALAAVLGGLFEFALFSGSTNGASANGVASIGARAPEITLTDFDGETFSLADYLGTPIVLNFWASWCPVCAGEMPDFERVHQELGDKVVFLGVDQRDDRGEATDLAHSTHVTYRLADDPQGVVYDAFGTGSMPTTAFITADGKVADVVAGGLTADQLRDLIERDFSM